MEPYDDHRVIALIIAALAGFILVITFLAARDIKRIESRVTALEQRK